MRVYANGKMTISADSGSIKKIQLIFGNGDKSNPITANVGTLLDSIWTGDASLVEFTVGGTSGHRRIAAVKITDTNDRRPSFYLKHNNKKVTTLKLKAINVANQVIDLVPSNFSNAISSVTTALYSDAECNNFILSDAWITNITFNEEKTRMTFDVADNLSEARELWLKVIVSDDIDSASAILNISQVKYLSSAILPFYFDGGRDDAEITDGILQEGLGDDYTTSPKLKFDGEGDYLVIRFSDSPEEFSFIVRGDNFKGEFVVQESADGEDYTDIFSITYEYSTVIVPTYLKDTTRYVKFCCTRHTQGSIALGDISISKMPTICATPTFSPEPGTYEGPQYVTISSTTRGATIYYTTDGTTPTINSSVYTKAIRANRDTTIKAIAIREGLEESEVATAEYIIHAKISTGQCGDSLSWTYNSSTEVLTITGNGRMPDWQFNFETPWVAYRDDIIHVDIEDGVENIGQWAFSYFSKLASISIPESVKEIGWFAFYDAAIPSIAVSNNVTTIGTQAFYNIVNIMYSGTASGSPWGAKCINGYTDGWFSFSDSTKQYLRGCSNKATGDIHIPSSTTTIGEMAFAGCMGIKSVHIPGSVLTIEREAFVECENLKEVYIEEGLQRIEDRAFQQCRALQQINIPNSLTYWGYDVVDRYNSRIRTPLYNDTLFVYMPRVYKGVYEIPEGITTIYERAFEFCEKLTGIIIPSTLTEIHYGNFYGCYNLESIQVASQNTVFDSRNNCNAIIETATNTLVIGCQNTIIPEGIVSLGSSAFYSCTKLQEIIIPNTVTNIQSGCFDGCTGLKNIDIPNSVQSIGSYAFCRCSRLRTITLGAGLETLEGRVFAACPSIKSITCKATTPPILRDGDFADDNYSIPVYVPCESIKAYKLDNQWPFTNYMPFNLTNNINFETDSIKGHIEIISTGESCDSAEVSIRAIAHFGYKFDKWADENTENPRKIKLVSDTTFTAEFMEANKSGYCGDDLNLMWEYDEVKKSLTILGNGTLHSNYHYEPVAQMEAEKLIISNGVTSIGRHAFSDFINLQYLEFAASVETIDENAFSYCSNLRDIYCYREVPPAVYNSTFENVDKSICMLHVLSTSIGAYLSAEVWEDFLNIMTIGASGTTGDINDVGADPSANEVTLQWPTTDDAETYDAEILQDGDTIWNESFDSKGQMVTQSTDSTTTNSTDLDDTNYISRRSSSAQNNIRRGFTFTVSGLESSQTYCFVLCVKGTQNKELSIHYVYFDTKEHFESSNTNEGIDNLDSSSLQGGDRGRLILHNGQIFILRGDKTYTLTGAEVK